MNLLLAFLLGGIIGFLARGFFDAQEKDDGSNAGGAHLTERERKVLAMVRERGRIKNQDVEKLLRVSDATATRILDAMELKGVLTQHKTGSAAYYAFAG